MAAHQAGDLPAAEQIYRAILEAEPADFDALHMLGVLEAQRQRYDSAHLLIGRALAGNPRSAMAHSNRGYVLVAMNRPAEALASLETALALDPAYDEALNNRGNALQALGRHAEALRSYEQALAVRPDWPEAMKNLGNVQHLLGRYEAALATYGRVLALRPGYREALNDRGAACYQLGLYKEALDDYAAAQAVDPAYAEAHWNEGICRLLLGDYARGWEKYEWRWRNDKLKLPPRAFAQPLWLGTEDLRGRSILLHAEQGLGDAIHFVRYAARVAALGADVTLETFPEIAPLMASLDGVNRVIARGAPLPQTDFHCPLLSLPLAFATIPETIPAPVPYLSVREEAAAAWRARLAKGGDRLVGVCWRGSKNYGGDAERSIAFADFAPLLSVPGFRFFSLQKELTGEERRLADGLPLIHGGGSFNDTAEMVAALDLVISVDTVWAHWAGAIGKPFWLLLPHTPHWVWLTGREDSPWYPTARLFRQARTGAGWESVIRDVKIELAKQPDTV
ncbi:MAG TPA: tetratricopeptide repeat protein [Burkholderiales bacterium]|nr:tetratricopeptide repeat protein [Burkholderiales bacterium]